MAYAHFAFHSYFDIVCYASVVDEEALGIYVGATVVVTDWANVDWVWNLEFACIAASVYVRATGGGAIDLEWDTLAGGSGMALVDSPRGTDHAVSGYPYWL